MNEKNAYGKQRKAAPAKQARSKSNKNIGVSLDIDLPRGSSEIKPHWFITPLLLLSVAGPFLPRAEARSVLNNNTAVPKGDHPLTVANNSTQSAVSVENPSQSFSPPPRFVDQKLPIIPMQSAVVDKNENKGKKSLQAAASMTPIQSNIGNAKQLDLFTALKEGNYPEIERGILAGTAIEEATQLLFLSAVQEGDYQEAERRILDGSAGSLKHEWDMNGFKHTYMELAALSGQINIVKLLKKHGVDINVLATNGWATPLAYVIYSTDPVFPVSYIEEMIELGANPNFKLPSKPTNIDPRRLLVAEPAFNAIYYQQRVDILELLLAKKYINLQDAFQYALLFPHRKAVEYVIKQGINLYAKNPNGSTYLHLAVINNLDSVKHILELAPNLINVGDNKGDMPLHVAAARNELEMVHQLLKAGAIPEIRNRLGRTTAQNTVSQEIKKVLLSPTPLTSTKADTQKPSAHLPKMWSRTVGNPDAPLKPNPFGENASTANLFNLYDQLEELPATDCHVIEHFSSEDHTQRFCVIYTTEPSMIKWNDAINLGVKELLSPHREVLFKILNMWDVDQRQKLVDAIIEAASQQVGRKLDFPYSVNDKSEKYAYFQRPHILIKSNSIILQQDQNKFIQAIKSKDRKTFDELLAERKVDITGIAEARQISITILQLCSVLGEAYFVEKLLSLGVDVNEKYSGATALHLAIKSSARYDDVIDAIKVLLKHGADPHLPGDNGGGTPLALAEKIGKREILKLLSPTTYSDSSPSIFSKQKIAAIAADAIDFVYAYPYEITLATALLLILGIMWWIKKNRDNELKIKQSHILKHEEYLQKIFQTFFNVEKLPEFETIICLRLTLRSSQDLQPVLRELYASAQQLPIIKVDINVLMNQLIPILAKFYGESSVKWHDDKLSVEIESVLPQTPPEFKRSDLIKISKFIVENSPEFRDEQDRTKRLAEFNYALFAAKKSRIDFEANLQGFRNYMAVKKITLEMLDNCTEKVGKTANQVRTIKLAMSEINRLDEEYKKNIERSDRIYAANGQLLPGESAQIAKQKIAALKERETYYGDKNKSLLKYYDGNFVEIIDDLIKDKKLLLVAKTANDKQESKKSSSSAKVESDVNKKGQAPVLAEEFKPVPSKNIRPKNDDEEESEQSAYHLRITAERDIEKNKSKISRDYDHALESDHNEDEIEQDLNLVQSEQLDESSQHNLELRPPSYVPVDQMPLSSADIQTSLSAQVVQPPSPASVANPRKTGKVEIIINYKGGLFQQASPPPVLPNPPSTTENRARFLKAPQQAVALSAEELVSKIKDHALGLSVLVATVSDYDFSNSSEHALYRNALFYHLLRLFHGMWLLKLGNPDESINLRQVQKMRNLLAHHSENASQDELLIFANEIRNKLFPDTQIVGTKEQQGLLAQKFRRRLYDIDIDKTDLYKDLRRDEEQSVLSESDCYLKIVRGFHDAQILFKEVNSGSVFQNNPDRSAAVKALLANIGDNFMQIRDYYPESWKHLSQQFGEEYFNNFIRFRNCIYHNYTGAIDINNRDLYHEAQVFLRSDHVKKMLEEMKKVSSNLTLSPPKA